MNQIAENKVPTVQLCADLDAHRLVVREPVADRLHAGRRSKRANGRCILHGWMRSFQGLVFC